MALRFPRLAAESETVCALQVAGHRTPDGAPTTLLDTEGRLHKELQEGEAGDREAAFYACAHRARSSLPAAHPVCHSTTPTNRHNLHFTHALTAPGAPFLPRARSSLPAAHPVCHCSALAGLALFERLRMRSPRPKGHDHKTPMRASTTEWRHACRTASGTRRPRRQSTVTWRPYYGAGAQPRPLPRRSCPSYA